jgi:hypothetical protein
LEPEYPKILASREASSMVSTWTEYLRLSKPNKNNALLEICRYEGLGEQKWDEEGEPVEPPDEIDGKKVVGVEDGIIIGGELTCWHHDESFAFMPTTLAAAIEWLKSHGWKITDKLIGELRDATE